MGVCNETNKRQNPLDKETSQNLKLNPQNENPNLDKIKLERKAKKRLTISK